MFDSLRTWLRQTIRERTSLHIARRHFSAEHPRLFTTIELELRSMCNGTCPFCAAAAQFRSRPDRAMPDETFCKIVDELAEMNYDGRICFFVNTEPLLDKRLLQFVGMARRKCSRAKLHVMTNGLALTPALGVALLDAGLDLLEINHYSDNAHLPTNIEQFMRDVAPLHPQRVRLNRRKLTIQLNNRAGSSPNGRVLERPIQAFCQRPFEKMMISAEGKMGLCEHDFYFSEKLGNVNEHRLRDLWYSQSLAQIRRHLMLGDRAAVSLCSKCDYSGYRRISNPRETYRGQVDPRPTGSDRMWVTLNRWIDRRTGD